MAHANAPRRPVAVVLEIGRRRVFASSLEWPGWCRSGRDEAGALAALAAAGPRYRVVAAAAGLEFPVIGAEDLSVGDRLPGSVTTDFGAPAAIAPSEQEALPSRAGERMVRLLGAAWSVLDRVAADAPPTLRKGPRGGGRDRDQVVDHVLGGEVVYASKLGLRLRPPARDDARAVAAHRRAITDGLLGPPPPAPPRTKPWPRRYAIRRLAWHVLDHAWEIEDRS